jgi:hypothetical protein
MPAKKPKPDEKPQNERFIEAAREVGADETQKGFEEAFEKIIHPTSPPKSQKNP